MHGEAEMAEIRKLKIRLFRLLKSFNTYKNRSSYTITGHGREDRFRLAFRQRMHSVLNDCYIRLLAPRPMGLNLACWSTVTYTQGRGNVIKYHWDIDMTVLITTLSMDIE